MKCTDAQIEEALNQSKGNRTKAAKALGISLTTLRKRIKTTKVGSGHKGVTVESVIAAMHKHKGNRSAASRELDISPPSMYHHLAKIKCVGERYNPYVSDLWLQYSRDRGNKSAFNSLMVYYSHWVTSVAKNMSQRYPNFISLDDLIQEGCIALMEVIPKYDYTKGNTFVTYAQLIVRGRILDYLRSLDHLPRGRRTKSKVREAMEQLHMNMTPEALCEKLGWSEQDYKESLTPELGSIEQTIYTTEHRETKLSETLSYAIEHPAETGFRLAEFTKAMNVEEAIVIYGYYWKDKSMKEIGQFLNLSESRVSQLHSRILDNIRAKNPDAVLESLSA